MKKNSIRDTLSNLRRFTLVFSLILASQAFATAELDRVYSLENIGLLKASDNMDGFLGDYVVAAYKDYFLVQSRFVLQDLTKSDAVMGSSKLPYSKLIDDSKLLSAISKATHSDSLIRTKVSKEGPRYRFVIDWLHAPDMELMATVNFTVDEQTDRRISMSDIRKYLQIALDKLIAKIPFKGQVTGRDHDSVTLNIGLNSGLKKGDEVVVGTIEEVKKHPLLHSIVDWRFSQTGKIAIESVDEGMAFGRVIDEDPSKKISRLHKVTEYYSPKPKKPEASDTIDVLHPGNSNENGEESDDSKNFYRGPRLGFASGGLWFGVYSRNYSAPSLTTPKTGGGLLIGVKPEAQVWLNKNWFADIGFLYGFSSYSPNTTGDPANDNLPSVNASVKGYRIGFGYNYYLEGSVTGPKAYGRLSFKGTDYDITTSKDSGTSSISSNGLSIGFGGDLPIRDGFGAFLSLDLGMMMSATETGLSLGDASSVSDASFVIGGYYRLNSLSRVQAGIDFMSTSADFSDSSNISNKVVAISGAFLFYF